MNLPAQSERIHSIAYVVTLIPILSAILLIPFSHVLGPAAPLIMIVIVEFLQCIGFIVTLIRGKNPTGFKPGTKPLLWLNAIAIGLYPVLFLYWILTISNAMSGINT